MRERERTRYMRYCCVNCISNKYLKEYIKKNNQKGSCNYCNSENVNIVSTKEMGKYVRECLEKAYEDIEEGTGAYYDWECHEYCNASGESPQTYSIKEIMIEEEDAISDGVIDTSILEDIFLDSGPSFEEKKDGEFDSYENIEDPHWVISNDLYGQEATKMYYSWEIFKHTVKHYNRFFDIEEVNLRERYLYQLRPYILEYERNIAVGSAFYRVREQTENMPCFDELDAYRELSPAPPKFAKTNRMSPAGISYLYLASDKQTAYEECRYKNTEVVVAEYISKEELAIIDFSQEVFIATKSIFSEEYDHDFRWINRFLENFVNEITCPVDDNKSDHSYEYVSTQIVAEYIRSLGYDGICFNSSVGSGKSYVFFCGPNMECSSDEYGFENEYLKSYFPMLRDFTDWFEISRIELNFVLEDGRSGEVIHERMDIKLDLEEL